MRCATASQGNKADSEEITVLVNALAVPLDTAVLVNVTIGKAQNPLLEWQSQFIKGSF